MTRDTSSEAQSDRVTLRDRLRHTPSSNGPSLTQELHPDSQLHRVWNKIRLTPRQTRDVVKLSLPPIISLAIFQSDFIANYFTTNGYIIAMISYCMMPALPRARFLRGAFASMFSTSLATAISLLALWCGIQARQHTTTLNSPPQKYNSSQSAILGIYLLPSIFFASSIKSAYPTTMVPVLLFEIYMIVACTSGVSLVSMDDALEFNDKLLVNFLFGIAIAMGVNLLIFPLSCRQVFLKSVTDYLETSKSVIHSQQAYLRSLERQDPWHPNAERKDNEFYTSHKKALTRLSDAATKMRGEQGYAEREIAYGRFSASEIAEISDLFLRIMPAFSGIGFICDILNRKATQAQGPDYSADSRKVADNWQKMMHALHDSFMDISDAMHLALEHVIVSLRLKRRDKYVHTGPSPVPGSADFLAWYDQETQRYTKARETVARLWFEMEGIELPNDVLELSRTLDEKHGFDDSTPTSHRKPFTIIYIQYLLFSASRELLDLIIYVDAKRADGTLSKRRLIGPTFKRTESLYRRLTKSSKTTNLGSIGGSSTTQTTTKSSPGPQTNIKRDPEHLPAVKWWEIAGAQVRLFSKFMRSTHANHGLRVACAVMSIAIGFYIRTSSEWFSMNRWLWAMFAIVLTMNRTAGVSLFSYLCRISGTALAMAASLAVWYMVDGHTAGVIVMLWVWFLIAGYAMMKFPFYASAVAVSVFASIVMVGNELQDRKLGFARVEALGQAAHEEYLMAPERLAVVSAGVGVAAFWTIFPYPLSEHTELRQDLAATFYYLASYHSMISQTVTARAKGLNPHMATRNQNELARIRAKCFVKIQFLFGRLRQHLNYTKYQIILGGRFPTQHYTELVDLCERISTASAVIGYSSTSFVKAWEDTHNSVDPPRSSSSVNSNSSSSTPASFPDPSNNSSTVTPTNTRIPTAAGTTSHPIKESTWLHEFRTLLGTVDTVTDEVTSTLVMLSNHLSSGSPFPPTSHKPPTKSNPDDPDDPDAEQGEGKLARLVRETRCTMLTINHVTEPGYAAFVTMNMAGKGINRALNRQVEICKELMGVLDFSNLVEDQQDLERQDGLAAEAAARDDLRF